MDIEGLQLGEFGETKYITDLPKVRNGFFENRIF
jgi:hypothetical protein